MSAPQTIIGDWRYTLVAADRITIDWCGSEDAALKDQGYRDYSAAGGDVEIDDVHAPTDVVLSALGVNREKRTVNRSHGWAIYDPEGWLIVNDEGDGSHHWSLPADEGCLTRAGVRISYFWSVDDDEREAVGGAL